MQYDNVQNKTVKKVGYLDILKSQIIQRVHLDIWTNEKDTACAVEDAFYAESGSILFCFVDKD